MFICWWKKTDSNRFICSSRQWSSLIFAPAFMTSLFVFDWTNFYEKTVKKESDIHHYRVCFLTYLFNRFERSSLFIWLPIRSVVVVVMSVHSIRFKKFVKKWKIIAKNAGFLVKLFKGVLKPSKYLILESKLLMEHFCF